MKKREKIDLILVLIWPIVASVISIILEEFKIVNSNFFLSIIFFLGIPAIYLSFRNKKFVIKSLIPSLIIACPLMILIEYFGHISLAWSFPPSIFPFKIFGIVILEVLFWIFFNVYYVIIFYESFLDHHITKRLWEPKFKYLLITILAIFIIFLFFAFNTTQTKIPYFYFLFGILLFGLPVGLQLANYSHTKKVIVKILKASAYFFYLSFIYEILALRYGWWNFPSNDYIGWLEIFGVRFPLEEFIWWILLFAFAMLVYYEYFDDDEK
jgi:hypothetical protein